MIFEPVLAINFSVLSLFRDRPASTSDEKGTTAMILAKIGNITPASPGNSPKAAFMHITPLFAFIFSDSKTAIAAPAE